MFLAGLLEAIGAVLLWRWADRQDARAAAAAVRSEDFESFVNKDGLADLRGINAARWNRFIEEHGE